MTQDYKKRILEYLLGKTTTSSEDDREIFEEIIESPNWSNTTGILPDDYVSVIYIGMVAPNEETSSVTVLYGYYTKLESGVLNYYGVITLVDENFNPIKSFFNVITGTKLRPIYCMEQATDNTFYAIDKENAADGVCRLVMFNNFTIKNDLTNAYELRMRKTYAFGSSYRDFRCTKMFKNPDTGHYIFFGNYYSDKLNTTRIVDLKVNVGSSNEWSQYTSDSLHFVNAIATFNGSDQVRYRAIVDGVTDKTVYSLGKGYSATNPTSTTINTFSGDCDITLYEEYCSFINYNKVYFSTHNQFKAPDMNQHQRFIGLYCYNYSTSEFSTIYSKNLGNLPMTVTEEIFLSKNQGELYVEFNNNFTDGETKCDYYLQRLVDDTWNPQLVASSKYYSSGWRNIYVKNNFNLVQVYLYQMYIPDTANIGTRWFQCVVKENYNPANYNGYQYDDYNSLIPQQATVYSNGSLVFARNLYNLTINDNQTNATVVIPNTYLNGIALDENKLLSQTKTTIADNTNAITKNIYEILYLNYINTINVYDEADGSYKPNLANYVNKNINTATKTNSDNTKIGKLLIHYISHSSRGHNITFKYNLQWIKIDNTHYEIKTAIKINNGDIITWMHITSEDENTTYVNITDIPTQLGTYVITQRIRIE